MPLINKQLVLKIYIFYTFMYVCMYKSVEDQCRLGRDLLAHSTSSVIVLPAVIHIGNTLKMKWAPPSGFYSFADLIDWKLITDGLSSCDFFNQTIALLYM